MRLILTILLIGLFKAEGQMIINASVPYRPTTQPIIFTGILDDYPGARVAYALRKLDKDYTGNCIRIRRSNDNTEQDIGFTANGDLDTAAMKTFVGNNNGFVVTWYNQADSSGVFGIRNATQSTANNQPQIITSGTIDRIDGDIVITAASGTSRHLISPVIGTNASTVFSTFLLLSRSSSTGNDAILLEGGAQYMYLHYGTTFYVSNATTNNVTLNTSQTLMNIRLQENIVGNDIEVYRNNTLAGSMPFLSGTATFDEIPSSIGRTNTIRITELIVYYSNQDANRSGINGNINSYWSIY